MIYLNRNLSSLNKELEIQLFTLDLTRILRKVFGIKQAS